MASNMPDAARSSVESKPTSQQAPSKPLSSSTVESAVASGTIRGGGKKKTRNERKEEAPPSSSAIADIFSSAVQAKKRRVEQSRQVARDAEQEHAQEAKKRRDLAVPAQLSFVDGNPRVHRVDAESGLPVYKYFDLGMAKPGSGFTPKCPFDCDCCY